MSELPSTRSYEKLGTLFGTIQEVTPPSSATVTWLKSIGFKSSYDESMLHVLDCIGFRDSSKKPTDLWHSYLDASKSRKVLAQGLKQGYAILFESYRDANARGDDVLKNLIKPKLKVGDEEASAIVTTFKALCDLADFSVTSDNGATTGKNGNTTATPGQPLVAPPQNIESPTPTLHIDFQVHIAADAPPEQIDKIFESMAKHLYGKTAE